MCSPHMFSIVEVGALWRPFKTFNPKPVLMCVWIIVLLERLTVAKFQPPSQWFDVKLKNLDQVLHYYIHFVQCILNTGSSSAQSMMVPPPCLTVGTAFLGLKAWLQTHPLVIVAKQPNLHLTIKLFSRRPLAWSCGQHPALVLLKTLNMSDTQSFHPGQRTIQRNH